MYQNEVDEWVTNANCLALLTSSENKDSSVDYYRCRQIIRSKYKECPVRAKVEKPANDLLFRIYYTTWEHQHPAGSEKFPDDIKTEIIQQHRHNMRPHQIFDYMKERFGERFSHFNITQLRYIIRKHALENIPQTVNIGDLVSWIRAHRNVPKDHDTPFVLSFTQSPVQNTFNAVFSTLRLLSHAKRDIWCADTTYQTNWQGYPVSIAGSFDRIGQFHFLALSLSTNEKTDDYALLFASIKNAVSVHLKANVSPKYIMCDAANQISNGFKHTFPEVENNKFWNLMCEFHVMKAVNSFSFNKNENKLEVTLKHFSFVPIPMFFLLHSVCF